MELQYGYNLLCLSLAYARVLACLRVEVMWRSGFVMTVGYTCACACVFVIVVCGGFFVGWLVSLCKC